MDTPKRKAPVREEAEVLELIERAKDAEACRDMTLVREILRPVWQDLEFEPDYNTYSTQTQADLYRLSGFLLAFLGNARSKSDCQERGRDLLTKAISLYSDLGNLDGATEARIFLAIGYWYEGAAEESEAILNHAEAQFKGDRQDENYLQICYYRLISFIIRKDFEKASEIIEEMRPLMVNCKNERILALYHTEAGVDCRRKKDYKSAVEHYETAMRYARDLKIMGLVSANLNNLAFLHKETGRFEKAHEYVDQAIDINVAMEEPGFLAHKYDTKALIYFDTRDYQNTLVYIEKAIDLFRQGEDYLGLANALFTKCEVLLRLGRIEEATSVFAELHQLAVLRLGKAAAERFAKDFSKLVYAKRGVTYREEVKLFKKHLIRNAFVESEMKMSGAREKLSISQDGLSEILNKQFPELCEEIGIKRTASQPKIEPVRVDNVEIEGVDTEKIRVFKVYKEKLPQLKASADIEVAVLRDENAPLVEDKYFLVQCQVRHVLECGLVCKDEELGLFYFENDGSPCPFTAKDVRVVGEIVGYRLAPDGEVERSDFMSL